MTTILECIANGLRWDLIAIAFAVLLWPAFHALLPKRLAWGGARLASPILIAYFALLPALVHRPTPFSPLTIAVAAGILGFLAWVGWGRGALNVDRRELVASALSFEKAHLAFLLLACCYVPFIDSLFSMGERLRDTGILNAILTQQLFPVEEPWFAGVRIQYYTFGYYVPSVIALFTGKDTLFTYNLIIAWTFASYGAAAWLFFRALGLRWGASFFGAGVIALSSNGASLLQAAQSLFAGAHYDWWSVSRVIQNTITEFPLWTASLGDLHPHYLTMPIFPLLLAWIASQLYAKDPIDRRGAWRYGLVSALIIAWIWGANTWELPVCYAVALVSLWLCAAHLKWAERLRVTVGMTLAMLAFALLFLATTPRANKTWGWVHTRSSALEILLTWGLFLLPIWIATARRLRRQVKSDWLIAIGCLLGLSVVVQSGALLVAVTLALVARAAYRRDERPPFPMMLALAGLALVLLCELVHLNDIFGDGMERLNTVFKFYMPAWAMLAGAAALCALEVAKALPKRWAPFALAGWAVLLSGHLVAGLSARTGGWATIDSLDGYDAWARQAPDDARLMRWARGEVLAHRLSGTILEASGGAYQNFGRVMTAAGLPGYFAWEGYGGMLQTLGDDPQIDHRMRTVKEIFNGTAFEGNCDRVHATLAQERIDYVVIGSLEQRDYSAAGLELLKHCLPLVHQEGSALFLAGRSTVSSAESLARGQGK